MCDILVPWVKKCIIIYSLTWLQQIKDNILYLFIFIQSPSCNCMVLCIHIVYFDAICGSNKNRYFHVALKCKNHWSMCGKCIVDEWGEALSPNKTVCSLSLIDNAFIKPYYQMMHFFIKVVNAQNHTSTAWLCININK